MVIDHRGERCERGVALWKNHGAARCGRIAFDVYGIERQDYSVKRVYSAEPPSHWTSQSPGIQRYEHSNMAGDELRLLSLIGSQVYRLSDPTIQTPGHALA